MISSNSITITTCTDNSRFIAISEWLQSLRIPVEDSNLYTNDFLCQGFDDVQSILEDTSLSDLETVLKKPGHLKRILNIKRKNSESICQKRGNNLIFNDIFIPMHNTDNKKFERNTADLSPIVNTESDTDDNSK